VVGEALMGNLGRDLGRALWVMAVLLYLLAAACLTGVLR
jgi:hypothetical protein